MPTIESKKYGTVQFLDIETWTKWVETGRARHFKILDEGDLAETVIAAPEKIIEFSDTDTPDTKDRVEKVMSREEIKAELDKIDGLNYNTRASTEKLQELLNQNK